jgi:catechol 2,3-dioxygenase-like lactoylglutathione lyase family enzyme
MNGKSIGRCEIKINRIDHVGINVNDLSAAKAFFLDLGLEVQEEGELKGEWLDQIAGLSDVETAFVFMRTPDGETSIELIKYYSPSDEKDIQEPNANTLGIRHIAFVVEDIDAIVAKLNMKGSETIGRILNYEDSYRLCYIRGPEDIILELAEPIG